MDAFGEDQHTRLQRKIQRSVLSQKDYNVDRDMKNLIRKKKMVMRGEKRGRDESEDEDTEGEVRPDQQPSITTGPGTASEAGRADAEDYRDGSLTPLRASYREAPRTKNEIYLERKLRTLRENQAIGLLRLKEDLLRNPIINLKLQNEGGRYAKKKSARHGAPLDNTNFRSVSKMGAPTQHRIMLNSRLSQHANSTSFLGSERHTTLVANKSDKHINMVEGVYQEQVAAPMMIGSGHTRSQ